MAPLKCQQNLVRTVYFSRMVAYKIIDNCLDRDTLMLFTKDKVTFFAILSFRIVLNFCYLSGMFKRF